MAQTVMYRAPEVFMGAVCTRKSDMWSIGCVAAEIGEWYYKSRYINHRLFLWHPVTAYSCLSDASVLAYVQCMLGPPPAGYPGKTCRRAVMPTTQRIARGAGLPNVCNVACASVVRMTLTYLERATADEICKKLQRAS